jgi:PAS domain S-box-containing protein
LEQPEDVLMTTKPSYEELAQRVREFEKKAAEKQELEKKIHESEARFKTLFENAPGAIVIIDAETGKFVDANNKALRLFGLTREEFIGIGPLDISPPMQPDGRASKEVVHEKIQELLSENPKPFEWVHKNASGREFPCEIYHAKLPVHGRKLFSAIAIDIAEHRKAEAKIKHFQHIIESTDNPIGLVDRSFIYLYVNEPYCQALNKPIREIIGHSVPELLGQNFFETVMENHYKRCFSGETVDYQAWFDLPGWGRRYMDVLYYPFQDTDGRVTAAVVNAHDITEMKQLETKLKESEERFRAFMDNIPAVIYIKDNNDRHIYGNPAGLKSVQKEYDEFIGSTTRDLWPPQIADRLIELDRQVIDGEIPKITEEWSDTGKDEVRWRRDIKFPIGLESGEKLLGGIAIDITNLKHAEEKIEELSRFEQLLSNISTSFIDLPVEKIDQLINGALEQVGRFLRVDRCSLGNVTPDYKEMIVTHVWHRKPVSGIQQSYTIAQFPWLLSPFMTGKELLWSKSEGLPTGSEADIRLLQESGMQSFAGIPVTIAGELTACLGFSSILEQKQWNPEIIQRLNHLSRIFGNALSRKQTEETLRKAIYEIKSLKEKIEQENIYLREEIEINYRHDEIVGESSAIKSILSQAEKVADQTTCVVIQGETGTGKELLARAIHKMSPRRNRQMITVNCGALPGTLIENEMFGREKGAYTGAVTKELGRFEVADGSTIFLDEIGDLPIEIQSKLLRVIEKGRFQRLGSSETITVDVRIVAATNHDLKKLIQEGRFRKDLFYRLSAFPITVPPLRERKEDIPLIVWAFVKDFGERMGKKINIVSKRTMTMLQNHLWPGNVRELKNVVERAIILTSDSTLRIDQIDTADPSSMEDLTLADVEKRHILKILETTKWRVHGKNGAAEVLGLHPSTLRSRMKKLGIKREE